MLLQSKARWDRTASDRAIIALIGRELLWFIELEQLYPDEHRPRRSRLMLL
jgi:hypothetical protein